MTTFSFTLSSSTVALSAQGQEFFVDLASLHANALEAILIYGTRRWFQDSINSQAHTFRKAAESGEVTGEFDTEAAFHARLDSAISGSLTTPRTASSPAFTDTEEAIYAIAVEIKARVKPLATAWASSKGEPTATRKALILKAVAALPDPVLSKIKAAAQTRLDAMASLSF